MYTTTLTTLLLFTTSLALALPSQKRTPPSTLLEIRAVSPLPLQWNTTDLTCNLLNAHEFGEMGPSEDTWGDGGSYNSYSISRSLAANETLNLYSQSGGNNCGEFLYSLTGGTAMGCYEAGSGEEISCMKMATSG
ncbi:hypothetical protein BDR22DRAFT_964539 [Usnea florida]